MVAALSFNPLNLKLMASIPFSQLPYEHKIILMKASASILKSLSNLSCFLSSKIVRYHIDGDFIHLKVIDHKRRHYPQFYSFDLINFELILSNRISFDILPSNIISPTSFSSLAIKLKKIRDERSKENQFNSFIPPTLPNILHNPN